LSGDLVGNIGWGFCDDDVVIWWECCRDRLG